MEIWVLFAVLAAATQALRTAVQRRMVVPIGSYGAAYIRFSYACPIAWLCLFVYLGATGEVLASLPFTFWAWINIAALTQVIFTILLVQLFSHRSFAAAVAFSKTEVLQTAIFEALILGVVVTVQTGIAIAVGVFATVMLAFVKTNLSLANIQQSLLSRQMAIGLAAGAFLGFCTVAYGAAMQAMTGGSLLNNAIYAAAIGVTIQAACFGAYLYVAKRTEFIASFVEWRKAGLAGVWASICSICWFAAFLSHEVAPVRAVGQVELLFSVGFSILYFKERVTRLELTAMALLALSIIMVLLD